MSEKIAGFDWHDGNREKCERHGVSLKEIEALFQGEFRVAPTLKGRPAEDRYLAVGKTLHGRALFVAFTYREKVGGKFVRPISARYMHRKEAAAYEKAGTKA